MPRFKDVMGKFPFEPEDKKPALIRKDQYFHFLYPPDNPYTSDLNYLIVSTDKLLLGIYQLAPGSSFDPIDIHPGDEAYYILNGPVIQRNASGQFVQVNTGEGIWLPREAWHKAYNFGSEQASILFFIAPKAWDEHVPPAVFPSDEETKMYKGKNNDSLPYISPLPGIDRQATTDDIGKWPIEGAEGRKAPYPLYRIPEENKLVTIHGTKNPMLIKFTVSNDFMHMGEFILPAGGVGPRTSEPDSHKGDCVIYVLEGPITVNLPDTLEAFIVDKGDSFFLPEGTTYQLLNFNAHPVKAVFAIAPGI
ncbi:MAG TPA: cupin domain-containing protein [Anaerovoracaceae bacterium]|nr:cupin domain-containing protein [Anaerovoracaceae bacterium]